MIRRGAVLWARLLARLSRTPSEPAGTGTPQPPDRLLGLPSVCADDAGDFDRPSVACSSFRRHVLYRLKRPSGLPEEHGGRSRLC